MRPFAPPCQIAGREEELLLEVLRSENWSGFRAGAGGADIREVGTMSSAGALRLAPTALRFLGGPMVRLLEAMFAERCGATYGVAVNSATSGLVATFGALDLEPGDEVLVPCMSFHATATAILAFDAVPVFVEVDPETLCIDVADAESKITDRTRALAAVHLGGNCADLDGLLEMTRRRGLRLIEDCAQAPGARYRDREVGGFADAGIFSLTETKTITCGEGGVVVTNDPGVALKLRLIRNHGEGLAGFDWSDAELQNVIGFNLRLTELQAAVAVAQMERLDERNRARRTNQSHLVERLRRFPFLVPQKIEAHVEEAPYATTFRYLRRDGMPSRDEVVTRLQREGVPAVGGYERLLHEHPLFTRRIAYGTGGYPFNLRPEVRYGRGTLPRSEELNRELIWFTCINSPNTIDDMDDIVRAFEKVFEP
jgi:dTDP-4-amino-4,6-dideoxygalactose transaminase